MFGSVAQEKVGMRVLNSEEMMSSRFSRIQKKDDSLDVLGNVLHAAI